MVAPCLLATWLSCLVFPGLRSDTNGLDVRLDRRADVSVRSLANCGKKKGFEILICLPDHLFIQFYGAPVRCLTLELRQ